MKDAPTDLCRSLDSHIHIEWSVYSSGNLVAEGSSTSKRAGAWGATVSRVVGTFPAEEGREYSLKVKSLSDLVPLAVADPRIAIVNRSHATKGFAVIAHVVAFIAIVVMMVGGLLLLIRLAPRLVKSRTVGMTPAGPPRVTRVRSSDFNSGGMNGPE